ncbi:MAG: hypothetical protein AAB415_01805 [Patescibacteria group bacterium]
MFALTRFVHETIISLFSTIGRTAIVWLPIFLIYLAWKLWYYWKQAVYIRGTEWVMLDIRVPREISKSPKAMEVVLGIFAQTYAGNKWTRFTKGIVRSWFSLELVSLGGKIHFYFYIPKFFKNVIEAQIYSQYPGVEISETEDYVSNIPAYGTPTSNHKIWGVEFAFSKEDAYPIKTYVDYGLDKDPKEEFKIDPMTPMLEFLGSITPAEQVWIQILIIATRDRFHKPGTWFGKQGWKKEANILIDKLMKRDQFKSGPDAAIPFGALALSPGERTVVEAIERSMDKIAFDCGFRGIYLAPKDKFKEVNIVGLMSSVKQFNSANLNGFKPGFKTGVEESWHDFHGIRVEKMKRKMFDAYRRRAYFYPPYVGKSMVLNTEELATIYHFPGAVATTPTLTKIESKRGEPPIDLPL